MPYCRICGTKLEENARFCHKCGTPIATFTPALQAKPIEKNPFLVPIIILIALVTIAVIVGVFVFWTFYSVNFNQASGANQTNVNELSFNFHSDMAKVNVIAQNLISKTVLITTSANRITAY